MRSYTRRVRSASVAGNPFTGHSLTDSSSLLKSSSSSMFSRNGRQRGLQLRHLDLNASAFTRLAVDPHSVLVSEQHLEALVHVADSDAPVQQRGELGLGDANAIVFHHQMQLRFAPLGANANGATLHFTAEPVLDGVLH